MRNFNLIAQLATHHDVGLLSFADESARDPGPLAGLCRPVCTVPVPRRSVSDRLRCLLTTRDPDMAHRLWSPAFAERLRELLRVEDFEIVQVEGIELAPYALLIDEWLGARAPKIVFDDHNAEYVLQQRAFEAELRYPARWPAALYSLIQWRRLKRLEHRICRRADAVVAVSEADALALRRLVPGLNPLVVPNGVDVVRYHPELPDALPLAHPAIVFTGKMDFRPNVDAMLWFHAEVWPLVRARIPEARLYVVGKNPHARLEPLRRDPSVLVTGYVSDILPYFGGADVYVVPLRIGGGTRLKVLEAMAAGLPLVGTTLGIEGINLTPGQHALVADAPHAFAEAVIALVQDRARAAALGAAARQFVMQQYDWQRLVPQLDALYATL